MTSSKKILIVEDDKDISEELEVLLKNAGYETEVLYDFKSAKELMLTANADLILLDINIPYINGEVLLKELRRESDVPVIMVTSRNTEMDEVLSMSYGADDYITKPYNPTLLLLRINNIFKRMGSVSDELRYRGLTVDMRKGVLRRELPVEVKGNNVIGNTIYDKAGEVRVDDGMADAIGHNDLINDDMSLCNEVMTDTKVSTKKKYESKDIDSSTYIGSTDATQEILLTKNEMLIFSYLLNNQNRIVTRDELITDLWNNNEFVNDNTLTVNISRLRSKLREAGVENAIDTRKGQGYILQ